MFIPRSRSTSAISKLPAADGTCMDARTPNARHTEWTAHAATNHPHEPNRPTLLRGMARHSLRRRTADTARAFPWRVSAYPRRPRHAEDPHKHPAGDATSRHGTDVDLRL